MKNLEIPSINRTPNHKQKYKSDSICVIKKGTRIFSITNQLNFILDCDVDVRIINFYIFGKSYFVKPQYISYTFLSPIQKTYCDSVNDEWGVTEDDLYKITKETNEN